MRLALLTGVGHEGQVGEAVAARLAHDGFELILVDRTMENVEARAADIRKSGGTATPYSADLTDPAGVDQLFAAILGRHGKELDALVHMAGGFAVTGPVAESKVEDWDRQLAINLRTAFLTARLSIPMLRPKRGAMVFFASENVLSGAKVARVSAYTVAKIGVHSLAIAISQEESLAGVRANVLAPASIRTAANVAAMGDGARFVEREDVAATVSYLCSDSARAVTGQIMRLSPR